MAVKKSAKKTTTKKAATKKATAKKAAAKKTTAKKATAKKTTTRKSSSKKATRKTTTKAEETAAEVGTSTETAVATPKAAEKEKKREAGVSSMSVNVGHVFSLRPRVNTSYRPADFMAAKQLLQNETYANIEEAARAVIAKALELTHKGSPLQRRRGR